MNTIRIIISIVCFTVSVGVGAHFGRKLGFRGCLLYWVGVLFFAIEQTILKNWL